MSASILVWAPGLFEYPKVHPWWDWQRDTKTHSISEMIGNSRSRWFLNNNVQHSQLKKTWTALRYLKIARGLRVSLGPYSVYFIEVRNLKTCWWSFATLNTSFSFFFCRTYEYIPWGKTYQHIITYNEYLISIIISIIDIQKVMGGNKLMWTEVKIASCCSDFCSADFRLRRPPTRRNVRSAAWRSLARRWPVPSSATPPPRRPTRCRLGSRLG